MPPGDIPENPPSFLSGSEIAPGIFAPPDSMRFQFARSSGPGGQNVNKLNTKVELWVKIDLLLGLRPDVRERLIALAGRRMTREGELHLAAESSRSQESNRAEVLDRLRQLLLRASIRPRPRKSTRPTAASRRRRLEAKKRRGNIKALRRGQSQD